MILDTLGGFKTEIHGQIMRFPRQIGRSLAGRKYRRGDEIKPWPELREPAVIEPSAVSQSKKVFIHCQSRNDSAVSRSGKYHDRVGFWLGNSEAPLVKIICWVPKVKIHHATGAGAGQRHMKGRVTQQRLKVCQQIRLSGQSHI